MTKNYEISNGAPVVRTSDDIGPEFYSAFVRAQANIGHALADKINKYHRTKYADLASVTDAVRPAFSEQGLAVMQFPFTRTGTIERSYREEIQLEEDKTVQRPVYFDDGSPMMETVPVIYVVIRTRIVHESGQWLEQDLEIPVVMGANPAQAVGIATTYGQRYALRAIAGAPSDEDDDDAQSLGEPEFRNLGSGRPQAAPPKQTNKPAGPVKPQGDQGRFAALCDRLRSAENLTTLRALYESAVREVETKGTEEQLAELERVKDEIKAALTAPAEEPEQQTTSQPARGVKQGVKGAARGINF